MYLYHLHAAFPVPSPSVTPPATTADPETLPLGATVPAILAVVIAGA